MTLQSLCIVFFFCFVPREAKFLIFVHSILFISCAFNSYAAPAHSLDTGTATFIQKVIKIFLFHVLLIYTRIQTCTVRVITSFFLLKPRFKMISFNKVQMWISTSFSLGERHSQFFCYLYYISISICVSFKPFTFRQ